MNESEVYFTLDSKNKIHSASRPDDSFDENQFSQYNDDNSGIIHNENVQYGSYQPQSYQQNNSSADAGQPSSAPEMDSWQRNAYIVYDKPENKKTRPFC